MKTEKDIVDLIEKHVSTGIKGINTSFPAKIVEYDATTNKASVEILTQFKFKNKDNPESFSVLNDVPVLMPRGKNYINFSPIEKGDQGLLVFNKTSLNEFKLAKGVPTYPKEERLFSLSDGVFIAGLYGFNDPWQGSIPVNAAGVQVQAGTKVSIGNGTVEVLDLLDQLLTQLIAEGALTGGATYTAIQALLSQLKAI